MFLTSDRANVASSLDNQSLVCAAALYCHLPGRAPPPDCPSRRGADLPRVAPLRPPPAGPAHTQYGAGPATPAHNYATPIYDLDQGTTTTGTTEFSTISQKNNYISASFNKLD